jgi:hypothetical protein
VIVAAEAISPTVITELSGRGHVVGRLSVDVDVIPPVDQTSVRLGQCSSLLTLSRLSRASALRLHKFITQIQSAAKSCAAAVGRGNPAARRVA